VQRGSSKGTGHSLELDGLRRDGKKVRGGGVPVGRHKPLSMFASDKEGKRGRKQYKKPMNNPGHHRPMIEKRGSQIVGIWRGGYCREEKRKHCAATAGIISEKKGGGGGGKKRIYHLTPFASHLQGTVTGAQQTAEGKG